MALGMSESEAGSIGYRGTNEGSQMKADYGWSSLCNGTNSSGFSGLPGGVRGYLGDFIDGTNGKWWSSSPYGGPAFYRVLLCNNQVDRYYGDRREGYSVRCIQDSE